jgi:DNA invertase Pin-like site-specific DNA recombinase
MNSAIRDRTKANRLLAEVGNREQGTFVKIAAGLAAARARGRQSGRPKALDPNKRQLAVKLYNDRQYSIDEICHMMGISKPTLYNYVAEGLSR